MVCVCVCVFVFIQWSIFFGKFYDVIQNENNWEKEERKKSVKAIVCNQRGILYNITYMYI